MIIGIEAAHAGKPNRTGVEEYCWQVIQELKNIIPSSERVILYTNSLQSSNNLFINLPLNWEVKVLRWPFKKFWSQIRLSVEFLINPPDIFFAPGQLVPLICPSKTITTIHDSAFEAVPFAYRFLSRWYLKMMNRLVLLKSKIILTSTNFNKLELAKYYGQKAAAKTQIIPLAYDTATFNQTTAAQYTDADFDKLAKQYGLSGQYLLAVGRLEKKKNTACLVQAFNIIKKNNGLESLQLLLAGSPGAGYAEVAKEISQSPYRQDIIIPGYVSKGHLPLLMSRALVFVYPSLYEGFGIPLLENMAIGTPVVASDIPPLREVGGDAIIYANSHSSLDISQKILKIINDTPVRLELISKGKQRAIEFTWQKTTKLIWEAIVKLAQD